MRIRYGFISRRNHALNVMVERVFGWVVSINLLGNSFADSDHGATEVELLQHLQAHLLGTILSIRGFSCSPIQKTGERSPSDG